MQFSDIVSPLKTLIVTIPDRQNNVKFHKMKAY